MGALPIVLLILAMKIPIFTVMALVYWAARGYDNSEPEKELRKAPPRRPRPDRPFTRPRRRGPHGGAAAAPSHARRRPSHAPALARHVERTQ